MNPLDRWIEAACAELDIDAALVDRRMILDLAREAAHQVNRPAAPVTAFVLGIAVGRGHPPAAATRQLTALIERWGDEDLPNDPLSNDPLSNDS